jgi:uncharacterized protein (TIGR01244 family)
MPKFQMVSDGVGLAGALQPGDIERLASQGFRAIVNFRPDDEADGQWPAAASAAEAQSHGITFQHIPAPPHTILTDEVLDPAAQAIATRQGPILLCCASGQRAAIIWAATACRRQPVDRILEALRTAGFDLDFLRDDLDFQADRQRWSQPGLNAAGRHEPIEPPAVTSSAAGRKAA